MTPLLFEAVAHECHVSLPRQFPDQAQGELLPVMAGTGRLSRLWLTAGDPDGACLLEEFDGVRCVPRATAAVQFQFAERDEWITRADAEEQIAATREPKQARRYACDHAVGVDWLAAHLSLMRSPQVPEFPGLPSAQVWRYRVINPCCAWQTGSRSAADREVVP